MAPKVRPAKAQAIASADRASPVTPTSKQSEVSRQAYGSVLPILSKHHDSSTPIAGKTEAKLPVLSRSEIIKQKLAGLNKVSSPSNESSKSRTQGDSVSESPLVRSDPPAKPVSEQAKSLLVSDALQPVVAKAPTTLSAVPDRAAIQAKKLALLQEKMALLRSVVVKKPAPVDTYLADSQRPAEIRTGGSDVHNQQNAAAALPPTTSIAPGFLDEAAGLERDKSAMDGNALNTPFQSFNFQLATAGIPGLSSAALSSGFNTPSTGNPYSTPHVTQSSLRKRPVAADFNDEFAEQAPPRKRRYERDNDDGVVIPLSDNEDHDSDISSSEEGEISSGHSTHSEVGSQRQMKSGKVLNSTPLAKPANVFVRSAMSLHSAPRIQSPLPRSSVLPSTLSGLDEKIRKLKEQLAKKESKRPLEVASIDPIQGPNTDAPILTEFDEAATQVVEMELDRLIEQEGRRPTPHPTGSLMASETVTEQEVPPQQADDDPTEDITSNSVPTSDQSHTFAAAQHSTVKVRDDVRLEPTTTDAISQESSPSAQSVSSGSLDSTSMEEGEVSSAAVSSIQSRAMSIEGSPAASPSALNSDSSDEPTRSDPVDDNTGLEGDVAEKNSILAVVNPLPGAVSHTQPLDSDIGAINPQAVAMSEPSPLSDSVAGSEEESVAAEAPEPRNPETQMVC